MTRQQPTDEQIEARFLGGKPGRKPMPAAPAVPGTLNMAAVAEDMAAADQMIELRADYDESRDLANQLLGQAQMADSISKFAQTVSISKLAFVRENKLYKALKGKKMPNRSAFSEAAPGGDAEKMPNGSAFSGTWAEYCSLLGKSKDIVDLDIANLQAFGEEALESMSAMGIGYREMRQYRRLPEDQKLALIEVARLGDKESFVELAEEIIAKHAKEKAKAMEDLEAKDRVLAQKNELIDSLHEQVATKFVPREGSAARTGEEQTLLDEINGAALTAQTATRRLFLAADKALYGDTTEAIELAARQAVEYLSQQLVDIATEFNIAVDFESRLKPAWMSDELLAAMEAKNAAAAAAAACKPAAPAKTKLKSVHGAAK